jgi:hypothetical protein
MSLTFTAGSLSACSDEKDVNLFTTIIDFVRHSSNSISSAKHKRAITTSGSPQIVLELLRNFYRSHIVVPHTK